MLVEKGGTIEASHLCAFFYCKEYRGSRILTVRLEWRGCGVVNRSPD